jgi:hypothetical protein
MRYAAKTKPEKGLVPVADFEFISALFPAEAAWKKLRFLVARVRKSRNDQTYYEWFEYLYNEMKKREQRQ